MAFSSELATLRQQLLDHPVYDAVQTPAQLRTFLEHHVFAVWDFMSLLKRLQAEVTCVRVPWVPAGDPQLVRFVNEIVLGEECDDDGQGGYASHFELYLETMRELQANTEPIESLVARIAEGSNPKTALEQISVSDAVRNFVRFNLDLAQHGEAHEVAAAFFFGREDLIPEMFTRLIPSLKRMGASVSRLVYYVERHVELDGEHHGPLARRLLARLCGDDPRRSQSADACACRALSLRLDLWNAIMTTIS